MSSVLHPCIALVNCIHVLNCCMHVWCLFNIAGKDARKTGAGSFIKAASLKYQTLNEDEKSKLMESSEMTKELTISDRKKAGAKIFKKIQKQVEFIISCTVATRCLFCWARLF